VAKAIDVNVAADLQAKLLELETRVEELEKVVGSK
jgi:hypothetical protein